MERRYKIQCTPFYYKNWCTGPFFCLNDPRIRGWYQARAHPFSSGNGKGDFNSRFRGQGGPRQLGVSKLDARFKLHHSWDGLGLWLPAAPCGHFWQFLVIATLSIWSDRYVILSGRIRKYVKDCLSSTASAF